MPHAGTEFRQAQQRRRSRSAVGAVHFREVIVGKLSPQSAHFVCEPLPAACNGIVSHGTVSLPYSRTNSANPTRCTTGGDARTSRSCNALASDPRLLTGEV